MTMMCIYSDGGRALAGFKGHTGDCVTRAVAIATQQDYQTVYDRLAVGNANQRKTRRSSRVTGKRTAAHGINVQRKWFQDYMRSLGWVWTPTMHIGSGCKVHLREGELPMGRLIVSLSKHYAAVIDGVIYDTGNPSRGGTRCVYGYWSKGPLPA